VLEITGIVSRFHVIAVQELRANIRALRYMLKLLGPHWGVIQTDITKGNQGNYERLAFLFDKRVVQLSGLACELVIPPEQSEKAHIKPGALNRQFARTPYAVSFRAHDHTFILVTMHALYGEEKDRQKELKVIVEWAKDINAWDHNLIALGDFNIDRKGDTLFDAFSATGLRVPDVLDLAPRTIFDTGSDTRHFCDQIAWFTEDHNLHILSMKFLSAGYFDFMETALKGLDLSKESLS